MGYCFMTTSPLKTNQAVQYSYQHNMREITVRNADPSRRHLNEEVVAIDKGKNILDVLHEKEDYRNACRNHKMRSDATKMIEVMMTLSREDAKKIDLTSWKQKNVEWLKETFNVSPDGKDNVVSVIYHADESTIHMHALVVPMDNDGEFRASRWTEKRADLIKLQNTYAEKMKPLGLDRGLRRSVASHKDIRRFYTDLDKRISVEKNMEIVPGETLEQYQTRMIDYVKNLQAINMREVYEKDRQITELKTEIKEFKREHSFDEKVQMQVKTRQLEKEKEKWQGLERTYGSVKNIEVKIQTSQLLNDALVNCENTELRDSVLENIKILMKQEEERQKREKQLEKQRKFEEEIKKG